MRGLHPATASRAGPVAGVPPRSARYRARARCGGMNSVQWFISILTGEALAALVGVLFVGAKYGNSGGRKP